MRATTLILIGITLVALSVSFYSSFKEKSGRTRVKVFQEQIEKLKRNKKIVEETLRQTQERYDEEVETNKTLNEALAREQHNSKTLTESLQRQQKALQDAQTAKIQNKKASTPEKNRYGSISQTLRKGSENSPKTNFKPNRKSNVGQNRVGSSNSLITS